MAIIFTPFPNKLGLSGGMRYALLSISLFVLASAQNSPVFRKFEYKHSFRSPNLAQRDGSVPFWLVSFVWRLAVSSIQKISCLGVRRCHCVRRTVKVGSVDEESQRHRLEQEADGGERAFPGNNLNFVHFLFIFYNFMLIFRWISV